MKKTAVMKPEDEVANIKSKLLLKDKAKTGKLFQVWYDNGFLLGKVKKNKNETYSVNKCLGVNPHYQATLEEITNSIATSLYLLNNNINKL